MKVGDKVVRITRDNFPVAKVGDIGIVCAENEYTLKSFGPAEKYPVPMTIVSFNGNKPTPNITEYLQKINE